MDHAKSLVYNCSKSAWCRKWGKLPVLSGLLKHAAPISLSTLNHFFCKFHLFTPYHSLTAFA